MFMRTSLLLCIISLLLILACQPTKPSTTPALAALQKACDYLWNKQQADGGWHSETHGIMQGGEALSPFLLLALLEVPDTLYRTPTDKVDRALNFIRQHVNDDGVLGLSDPDIVDYPNYATAYALRVLAKIQDPKDSLLIQKMKTYLLKQQFVEARGIMPNHLAYGAWGFGEPILADGQTGHIDLSHTRRILQALRASGIVDSLPYTKSQHFLRLVQKHPSESRPQPNTTERSITIPYDGGFYASAVTLSTNKADLQTDTIDNAAYFRSYATATCDGLLGLLAAGYTPTDEPVQAALQWLLKYDNLDYPEGIPEDNPDQWHLVMILYHLAVRSETYVAMKHYGKWQEYITAFFVERQAADGSFSNPYGAPNKEDDPLLATTFMVSSLCNALIR